MEDVNVLEFDPFDFRFSEHVIPLWIDVPSDNTLFITGTEI